MVDILRGLHEEEEEAGTGHEDLNGRGGMKEYKGMERLRGGKGSS